MPKAGELTYLSALSDSAREHAENKPFSDVVPDRVFMDIGMIRMLLPSAPCRLLDLGCGTGWTSCFFAKMGYDVVGQDISSDMIQSAIINKQRYNARSANFVVSDYESMAYDEEFDAACFYDSLHHAEDEELALSAVYRALKPGGTLITHEPGQGHSENEHTMNQVKLFGVTEKDMPPSHIIQTATKVGFRQAKYYPFPADIIHPLQIQRPLNLTKPQTGLKGLFYRWRAAYRGLRFQKKMRQHVALTIQLSFHNGGIVVLTK